MNYNKLYLPKEKRKKILLLSDDITMSSGIGHMGKEIILNTAHRFNWVNLGAALQHPHQGKLFDLSHEVDTQMKLTDSSVLLYPNSGYGDADILRQIMNREKPDAIMIFTDPRYWVWLFEIEREIRQHIPILYLNIWDNLPAPMYNRSYYRSVDLLMAISKQTKLINELVLGEYIEEKVLEYVPHGVNSAEFYPLGEEEVVKFKKEILEEKEFDFILFFNSRNIKRKAVSDTILAFRMFCDTLPKEEAKKCAFILHTSVRDQHGTDLFAVTEALCDPDYINVIFSTNKVEASHLNGLYNIADATILLSDNEGWGLALTESVMAGTMIIANVTGGMQDQMRFEDEKGEWFTPTRDIPSNHKKTFEKHGKWAVPVFPALQSIAGSIPTPYIYNDIVDPHHAAEAIKKVYLLSKEERKERGLAGREWMMSGEANMSSKNMGENVIKAVEKTLETFKPRSYFDLIKVEDRKTNYIQHKLYNY